ncbi:hypothetical protein SAMN02746089_02810 [Caldanaerobius fijiensis DSM 17918]|uniref:Uncharacterized protein n=1 Tax=Caldanaerobius fijiensis DSM 17918 TaxID=1121256 RepID=A0A1M5FV62_9THEO|nr:hypothetical protein [Caldanaerobius fijiensis]SHF95082.1 hypothetical protein SAMN02746089_02810 [Caldanaerobius fijiensis DSM 17918]
MKFKIFTFLLLLILILSVLNIVSATIPLKNIIDKQSVNYSSEKESVLYAQVHSKINPKEEVFISQNVNHILKEKNKKINNINEIIYGNIFKEYHLIPPINNVDLYNQILNSRYSWKFPIYLHETDGTNLPISSALIDKTTADNNLKVVEVNTNSSPEICDILSDSNKLAKVIENVGIDNANNILIFTTLEQDFVYVSTNDNNYIIPLFSHGDSWFGMKSMTKYTDKEFVNFITSYINSLQAKGVKNILCI